MASESKNWIAEEFAEIDLGDLRLNKRARVMVEAFAAKPTANIPMACDGWTDMTAAYRFLDNDDVTWEGIMAPHWARTELRMAAHPVVLCLQDSTELDFNGQKVRGLGPLNYEARRGMYVHPTYAVTPQREPLGVCDAWMWAREAQGADGVRPGQKESTRWIEGYERVAEMAARVPSSRLVYVADREGDILALMQRAKALGAPADWLVRAKHNRCLPDGEKLWDRTCAGEPLAHRASWKNPKHVSQWANTLETYAAPIIGDLPVATVDTDLIVKVLMPIWETKTETATRVRARIESILDWATVSRFREGENPARWRGHLENLLASPNKIARVKNHPALPWQDIGAFIKDLALLEGVAARALLFTILTACRSGEVRGATWAEIDFEKMVWTIPAERMKAGKEHRVPLSKAAMDIIDSTARNGDLIFPGRRGGHPNVRHDIDGCAAPHGAGRLRLRPHTGAAICLKREFG